MIIMHQFKAAYQRECCPETGIATNTAKRQCMSESVFGYGHKDILPASQQQRRNRIERPELYNKYIGERQPTEDDESPSSFALGWWEETWGLSLLRFVLFSFINGHSCRCIRLIITLRCHKPAVDNFVIYFD